MNDEQIEARAQAAGEALRALGWRAATAESCTGGWVAKALTDVAGSSQWFERGYVTYSNAAKEQALGVEAATLARHGAVSREVVLQMADGALRVSGANAAVAVSGIAGPDGGTADKPVGLVWFALAVKGGAGRSELQHFAGSREAVRRAATARALELLAAAPAL